MTTKQAIKDAQDSFKTDKHVPINKKPNYLAIQARFKCMCKRPFPDKKKGECKKCNRKLRE